MLWQVRESQAKAHQLVEEFDAQWNTGARVRIHRVTRHFLEPGSRLRTEMDLWARYRIFSVELSSELATYECINIDDT